MSTLFVRAMDDDTLVNIARASAIRVAPSRHFDGEYVVLAHFSGRTTVVGSKPSQREAWDLAVQLAARANAGGKP